MTVLRLCLIPNPRFLFLLGNNHARHRVALAGDRATGDDGRCLRLQHVETAGDVADAGKTAIKLLRRRAGEHELRDVFSPLVNRATTPGFIIAPAADFPMSDS